MAKSAKRKKLAAKRDEKRRAKKAAYSRQHGDAYVPTGESKYAIKARGQRRGNFAPTSPFESVKVEDKTDEKPATEAA